MDKLTLILLAECQPRRALKWPVQNRADTGGWSRLAWCSACSAALVLPTAIAKMVLSEPGHDRARCNSCGEPLEFDDKVGLT